MLQEYLN
jgi:hypothetical protein